MTMTRRERWKAMMTTKGKEREEWMMRTMMTRERFSRLWMAIEGQAHNICIVILKLC